MNLNVGYHHCQGQVGLKQSLMAIHGNIGVDQTAPIISSIGFGQLLHFTPTTYDFNLPRDLEELLNLLGEYNGDKERLVSGWYSKHTPGGYANYEQFRNGNFFGTL